MFLHGDMIGNGVGERNRRHILERVGVVLGAITSRVQSPRLGLSRALT